MYTKIDLNTPNREFPEGRAVWVTEDFDKVFNRVYPINQPASNLEARQNLLYTQHDGRRIAIHAGNITTFEEVDEGPNDV